MPPKTSRATAGGETGDGRKQPTAQEAYLFYTIIKNMKGKPEIDWNAVAIDAGFKNAETAKVRYGQIRRKLGVDNWNSSKAKDPKDDDAVDDGAPESPAVARTTKKTAATPTSSGTGAGVKKRASASKRVTNPSSAGRSRKAKSQAIVKLEEGGAADHQNFEDSDSEMMIDLATPTKKKGAANRIKTELGIHTDANPAGGFLIPEFANFPPVLPEAVVERQAILVNINGAWSVSAVPIEVHAQWLARLPAHIQTQFYAQAQRASRAPTAVTAANANKNGGDAGNASLAADNNNDNGDEAQVRLLSEHFDVAGAHHFGGGAGGTMQNLTGLGLDLPLAMGMGYMSVDATAAGGNGANGNGNGNGNGVATAQGPVDLHSIPMHPSYLAQLEQETRELEARELEALDRDLLFGGGDGGHDEGGFC